ncbi:HepN domain protein [Treponema primitia ZAS-2]|uniref:HepN domain protein n=1 Tax=Treponema primitia (strain ATCC BAA-887 / DSM 12427 / ZAS-2) TaxID=545694 RepID=F5YP26_TREPZ|nr:HEPN domain-containing protein [Treponema primitia]AEF83867.1 HepN domain protein [Treponema primitia ZAS-2]
MDKMDNTEYAREWLYFAEMDLSSAEFLLEKHPVPMEIICYHCQQSAEKCLKGFLVINGVMPPKNHDLKELYNLCEPFNSNIGAIMAQCDALDPYGVQPRYPREIAITEQKMNAAIQNAKAIFSFMQPLIQSK